jgi:hypothetical protein
MHYKLVFMLLYTIALLYIQILGGLQRIFDLSTLSLLYAHNSNRNIRFKLTLLVLGRTSINSWD